MQVLRGLEVTQNKNTKTQKTNQSTLLAIDPVTKKVPHLTYNRHLLRRLTLKWLLMCLLSWFWQA